MHRVDVGYVTSRLCDSERAGTFVLQIVSIPATDKYPFDIKLNAQEKQRFVDKFVFYVGIRPM